MKQAPFIAFGCVRFTGASCSILCPSLANNHLPLSRELDVAQKQQDKRDMRRTVAAGQLRHAKDSGCRTSETYSMLDN